MHHVELIVGLIALLLPAAIMVVGEKTLYGKSKRKRFIRDYLLGVVVLNIWAIAIAFIFYSITWKSLVFYAYDFPFHYSHKINEVEKFLPIRNFVWQHINLIGMLAYTVLSVILAFIVPHVRDKFLPTIRQLWMKICAALTGMLSAKKRVWYNVLMTAGLASILFVAGSFKSGYHLDEMLTFGLANHDRELDVNDLTTYDGEDIWHSYLNIPEGGKFDYVNVYVEQAYDTHPPLYYMLIHTVSSLFSSFPIVLIGLLVHVPLACLVFWQLVWIGKKLGMKRVTAIIIAASYVLGMGYFNEAIVFFRMYGLLTVWVNFLIMVILHFPFKDKGTQSYYLCLGLVLLGGLMTQYYFVIIACFICLVYAILLTTCKNWDKLIKSIYTVLCSAALWLTIYPYSLLHIMFGTRGTESFENAASQKIMECLVAYTKLINADVFGNLLFVFIAIIACGIVIVFVSYRAELRNIQSGVAPYLFMIVPFALFVWIISKVAPYQTLRYVVAGCAIFYMAIFSIIINLFRKVHCKTEIGAWVCALIVLVSGYVQNGFPGLHLEDASNIASLRKYENSLCLFYYGCEEQNKQPRQRKAAMIPNLLELRGMRRIIVLDGEKDESTYQIEYDNTGEPIVVFVTNPPKLETDHESILNRLKQCYGLSGSEKLFSYGYSTAYVVK